MTDRLPSCSPKEVLGALQKAGWFIKRVTGSHHHLRHAERRGHMVVAMHPGNMPRPIVRLILRQAGLAEDQFCDLL